MIAMDTKTIKEYTKEELIHLCQSHSLTVGDLKKFLAENDLPDNAPVVIQRIEDVYYEKHGWGVYKKEDEHTEFSRRHNEKIKNGTYLDKVKYPNITEWHLTPHTEEQIREGMAQYHPAWSCVRYKDDTDILFIDLHY